MKIGFLGNANNYPFMLARALRSKGHDVVFVIDSMSPLNRPENRYPEITLPYPEWVIDCSGGNFWDESYRGLEAQRAIDILHSCDALVLNEFGPAIWGLVRKPAFVVLTGTDLEVLADLQYEDFAYPVVHTTLREIVRHPFQWASSQWAYRKKRMQLRTMIAQQRIGIRNSVGLNYFPVGSLPNGDRLLNEIGASPAFRVFFMLADVERYDYAPYPINTTLRVFNVARITWKKPQEYFICELDYKGTDILVRGLGMYARKTGTPLDIRFVRKGLDLEATKQLLKEEGLENAVTWLEPMSQTELYEEYKSADIVTEHFGQGSVGMGALDAMATGRPVVANCKPEIFRSALGEASPLCHAATAAEVCAQLIRLAESRGIRESIGKQSRLYVEKYFTPGRAADLVLEKLKNAV